MANDFFSVGLIGTGTLAIPTGKAHAAWVAASQERVTTTSSTIGSIKSLKVSGLNDVAFSMIRELRTSELKQSTKFRLLLGISLMLRKWAPREECKRKPYTYEIK